MKQISLHLLMETIDSPFLVTIFNLLIYSTWIYICGVLTTLLMGEDTFITPYRTITLMFISSIVGLYLFSQIGLIPYYQLPNRDGLARMSVQMGN